MPVAITILGLLVGSIVGIWFRNADMLGRDLVAEKNRWILSGLAMKPDDIVARFFDLQYPAATAGGGAGSSPVPGSTTVLFDVSTDECKLLLSLEGEDLRNEMLTSTHGDVRDLAAVVDDPATLAQVTKAVLCPAGQ